MSKYKAYPEYKDSGVEWIDSIPSHWYVKPTFALCEATTKKNIDGAESNVLSLSYGNIIPRDVETNFGLLPESFNTYQIIDYGDVILRLTDLQNDKNSLRVGLAKQNGIITSAYLKLKAKIDMNSNFLYRLLHSYDTTKVFYGMGGGLRQSMKFEDFRRLPLLLPPIAEQLNISAFLDHETAKIDNLIEKQQQLIELLKEKRQAVISHAVTKGLNPDVPMKDSGVEWLGEVPAHWSVKRLKHISPKVGVGLVINPSTYTRDEGVYFIFGGDVKEYGFDLSKTRRISPKDSNNLLPSRLNDQDLVSVRVGYPGITAVVTKDLEGSNCASIIIIRKGMFNSEWLCAAMNIWVGRQQVDLVAYGAAQKQFNVADAVEFIFPVPPYDEQVKIAHFVKNALDKFDALSSKAQAQITLLQERRTALISAAVTGKIDVRDWVAPETSESEVSQEATA